MGMAQSFKGVEPTRRKTTGCLDMSYVSVGEPQFLFQSFRADFGDDLFCRVVSHADKVSNNLTPVKPDDGGLRQKRRPNTLASMQEPPKPYEDIAARLIWHRETIEQMSQKEYAAKIGVKRTTLNNWESGGYRLSLDGALALRQMFGLSLDFMYEGIDDALPMTLRQAWKDSSLVNISK